MPRRHSGRVRAGSGYIVKYGLPDLIAHVISADARTYVRTQRRECKLTEVRIRPLPIPVISVMKSELCDFRVTK